MASKGAVKINANSSETLPTDGESAPTEHSQLVALQQVTKSKRIKGLADLPFNHPMMILKFKHQLVPKFLHNIGDHLGNPWELAASLDLVRLLQEIWDGVYPDHPEVITPTSAVYIVVCFPQSVIHCVLPIFRTRIQL